MIPESRVKLRRISLMGCESLNSFLLHSSTCEVWLEIHGRMPVSFPLRVISPESPRNI